MRHTLLIRIRLTLILFIIGLVLSGITAFPIQTQLDWAIQHMAWAPPHLQAWLKWVNEGVTDTNEHYPFMSYGTDWLAFAHIVIAVAFIGPLRDPVRNIWVIQFGIIACLMVFPLALIAGPIRHIPFYWQLIDCSFGVFGAVPLLLVHRMTRQLEQLGQ